MGFSSPAFSRAFAGVCVSGAFVRPAFSEAFSRSCGAGRRVLSLPVDVVVADARVFDTAVGVVSWALVVRIGDIDFSAQITGEVVIEAEEDAARLATLSLIPASAAQLVGLDSLPVTIDAIVTGGSFIARQRRFTGVVESVEFLAADRLATLRCRDGYQERIRACVSADDVIRLTGGIAEFSDALLPWNSDEPDPVDFFREVLGTMLGATMIDGGGVWRVLPWVIGAPEVEYRSGDVFDTGLVLQRPSRSDVPSAIVATLTHSFPRLHRMSFSLTWKGLGGLDYTERGINPPRQSMIADALGGLADWSVVGGVEFENFDPVAWPVNLSARATLEREWYQDFTRRYVVSIDMGGASDRDESVARAISADFDAEKWEAKGDADSLLDVYAANSPVLMTPEVEIPFRPTPPQNGAMDYFVADEHVVRQAIRQVTSEAVRLAAQGRRRQRVTLSRPTDLRLDVGVVVGVEAYGISAVGQVQSWRETYDCEGGGCIGEYVLACPDGGGELETWAEPEIEIPVPEVAHKPKWPPLKNWIGGSTRVYSYPKNTDSIAGHLTNVLFGAGEYDDARPRFVEQFRVVTPEIGAQVRDPQEEEVAVGVSFAIAGSGVSVEFG